MIIQGTPEWHQARCGRVTASRIGDLLARTKTGWGASRANYMAELVVERLTGAQLPGYVSAAMQHGTNTEAEARNAYVFVNGVDVEEVGFVDHPEIAMAGASPDGLIGRDGMVEFKCPLSATHIGSLLGGGIPSNHLKQMQWQMACTGRHWCDWVSYDPRLPELMRMEVRRVERSRDEIELITAAVTEFLSELDRTVALLLSRSRLPIRALMVPEGRE